MKRLIFIALGFIITTSTVLAQEKQIEQKAAIPGPLVKEVETIIDEENDRLVEIFKGIHQDPELGFMEVNTAKIVSNELKSLGYDVITGIAKTGVVAILKNGDGPVVMYRADMDAIAAEEKTGLPYASTKKVTNHDGVEVPVGHLCGHDAHTTWMLGMAKVMVKLKDNWSGTLVLVGQPSEETIEGATAMVNDGLYTTHKTPEPDYFIGLHTAPIPTGSIISSNGVLMAGTEQLDVTFYGQSAHGSMPQLSKDAGLMAAYAVIQYQAIISRVLDPRDPGVITVGAINAGVENNTIPGKAVLKLNFRFFSEEVRQKLFKGVKAVSEGIARTYGMPEDKMPTIVRKGYSSSLVNTDAFTDRIAANLSSTGLIDSKSIIRDFTPVTGSEDAHMLVHGLEGTSMAYLLVGTAAPDIYEAKEDGEEFPFAPHQSNYQVDLDAIPLGAKIASMIVLDLLIK
jgi:hippurate hydrolase